MINLNYCPKCGHESLLWDGEKKWSCSNCNYVLFHNVAGAVAVLLTFEDEIMFTRRNQEPGKGKLDLSGGFTDPKESAEDTCCRELFEELKINIQKNKLQYLGSRPNVYVYKEIPYNTLDLFFRYEMENKIDFQLEESEISDAIWIKKKNLNLNDIAFDSQKDFLKLYLEN